VGDDSVNDDPKHRATLIAMTQPLPGRLPPECADPGSLLAYLARISNAANQENWRTGPRLLRRLIRDGEWSPLDQVTMNFEIETNRRIARQMLRHWTIKPQEFSQRWAEVPPKPYYTELRDRDPKNRANSVVSTDPHRIEAWRTNQWFIWDNAWDVYQEALANGVHPEVAVAVLPEGMAPSRLYMQATVRTWLHYSLLRLKPNTQKEHRFIAEDIWQALAEFFPDLVAATEEGE